MSFIKLINNIALKLYIKTMKGGDTMLINIIISRIIMDLYQFSKVPEPLKPQVKQALIDLLGEDYAQTYLAK